MKSTTVYGAGAIKTCLRRTLRKCGYITNVTERPKYLYLNFHIWLLMNVEMSAKYDIYYGRQAVFGETLLSAMKLFLQ
jgi:hypothetical protein